MKSTRIRRLLWKLWKRTGWAVGYPMIDRVRAESLTYLEPAALENLAAQVVAIERRKVDGIILEAGCALGGSAMVIASVKSKSRPLYIHDVFGMIPPPSERDGQDVHERYAEIREGKSRGIGGNTYYGYEEDLIGKVKENFRRHGLPPEQNAIHLVQGLFQETLHPSGPVALAHIDSDWYDSVTTCLERIVPRLSPGGVLVVDDYDAWSGCRKAVDDYFRDKQGQFEFSKGVRLNIRRTG